MITVYELPHYSELLNIAAANNLPIIKKKTELRNRLQKCKSKSKRRKLLKEYRRVKSLCLGLMFSFTAIDELSFPKKDRDDYKESFKRLERKGYVHKGTEFFNLTKAEKEIMSKVHKIHNNPISFGGRCDIPSEVLVKEG